MDEYTKEGELLKDRFLKEFNEWYGSFYGPTGDKPAKTPSNLKGAGITRGATHRAVNSLIASPNNLNATDSKLGSNLDYIDNRMSKGDSMKSMMGGLRGRIQKATSGSDGARLAVTPYDAIHHQNPLGTYGPSLRMQNGVVRLDFFERAVDQGFGFAETDTNLAGHSLDPRAHDASVGGASKKNFARIGEKPIRELSAHPRNTNDPMVLPEKQFSSGAEMFEAAKPIFETNKMDVEIGKAADAPRRQFLNSMLAKEGIIDSNLDVFAADTNPETIKKARDFLSKRSDILEGAAKAFDYKEAKALIKKLSAVSLIGVGALGTAADAAETGLRTKVAAESKNPVDALQAAISAASTTVGATGVGEILGIPLEVVNMLIDQHRSGGAKQIRGRSGAKRAKLKARQKPL